MRPNDSIYQAFSAYANEDTDSLLVPHILKANRLRRVLEVYVTRLYDVSAAFCSHEQATGLRPVDFESRVIAHSGCAAEAYTTLVFRAALFYTGSRLPISPYGGGPGSLRTLTFLRSQQGLHDLLVEVGRKVNTQRVCQFLEEFLRAKHNGDEPYETPRVVEEGTENQRYEWCRGQLGLSPSDWSVVRAYSIILERLFAEMLSVFNMIEGELTKSHAFSRRIKLRDVLSSRFNGGGL